MHMHVIFRESELKSWLVMGTGSMMDWCTVGQLKPKDFVCLDQTWWLHVKAHFEGVIEGKTPITGNNFHKVKNRFSVCIVLSKKWWSCLRIVDDRSCWMVLVLPGVYLRDRPSFLVACTWLCCSWGNDPGCCHWHYVCYGNNFVLCYWFISYGPGGTEWLSLCCCWFLGDLSCKIFAEPCPCLSGLSLFYHASNVVIEGPEAGLSSSVIVKPSSIPVFNGSTAARKMERPNGASFMGCPDLVADTGHVPASFFARCIYWT